MLKLLMNNITLMQELKPKLEAEGFAVFYQEITNDRGVDQLIIPIAKEDGTAVNLEINTIIDEQGIYPETEFIQCFMAIPVQIESEKFLDSKTLLNKINLELPIGSFNLHEAGIIFYKYTLIIRHHEKEQLFSRLIDCIDISNHLFQNYENYILESLTNT